MPDMPRYILRLFNSGGWPPDPEPQEIRDDRAAYDSAIYSIRDLVASEVREGTQINLAHFIAIEDENGRELCQVRFREAVSFIDLEDARAG